LTFAICEIDGLGTFKVLKEADSLEKLSNMDILPGIFPAVFISREDVEHALYFEDYEEGELLHENISKLTDEDMVDICFDLQNQYISYGTYWEDLESQCEDLKE
jgi:hypothetical protein